jgi:hypothetical protein
MKDQFKAGDKVKRKADQMDSWWLEQYHDYGIKPDTVFEVIEHRDNGGILLKGAKQGYAYTGKYFELAEVSEETKMKEAFALARSLVGKTVMCDDGDAKYTVTGIIFRQDKTDHVGLGWSCEKFLKENGWLVGVQFGTMNYPVQMVKELPTDIDVKLNGSYTATVSKGSVKVGCQTFPIEKIQEIIDAHNKL